MADNRKIAEDVLKAVGGSENVAHATHCMTRLRLNLKDDSIPNDEQVKKIPAFWALQDQADSTRSSSGRMCLRFTKRS